MKKVLFLLVSVLFVLGGYAQNLPIDDMRLAGENHESLKVIYINKDVSTHFVLMEDIEYVDISVGNIVGNPVGDGRQKDRPDHEAPDP